jgi:holin-like protein
MQGLFCILICWVVGNAVSYLIDGYVSGNIIGMLLMFICLKFKVFNPEAVRPVAKFLLGTIALFFVPFGVGLMVSYREILDNTAAIVVATVVSTIAVIVGAGWVFQLLNRSKR